MGLWCLPTTPSFDHYGTKSNLHAPHQSASAMGALTELEDVSLNIKKMRDCMSFAWDSMVTLMSSKLKYSLLLQTLSLGSAYHLVAKDERQRNITNNKKPSIEVVAFKTFVLNKRDGNSWQKNKSNQGSTKRELETPHYTFCDKYFTIVMGVLNTSGIQIGGRAKAKYT